MFLWMVGINLFPALITFSMTFTYFRGFEPIDSSEFLTISMIAIFLGLLNGICFGLTHDSGDVDIMPEGTLR